MPRGALALSGAAVLVAAVIAVVVAVVNARSGLRPPSEGERSLTAAEWASCAEQIFTGRVTDVDVGPPGVDDGYTTLSFDVASWMKPATGDDTIAIDVPTEPGSRARLEPGEGALVVVQPSDVFGTELVRGDRRGPAERDLRRALAASDLPDCPAWAR